MQNIKVITSPYDDQESGTSGLRKKTAVFLNNKYYLENYIQSCINSLDDNINKNSPIILGGDGRFYNDIAIKTSIKILIANGFKHIIVCKDGILSTPACSHLIRLKKASFGIIFTASHNPAGKNGDVGIKLNLDNGGPAPVSFTNLISENSKSINEFHINEDELISNIDLSKLKTINFDNIIIEIIDGVSDYSQLMQTIFDFPLIKSYLKRNNFMFDALNAVTGSYATEIFCNQLGVEKDNIINAVPKPDFGGIHPDPNPTTAKKIYDIAMSDSCDYSLLAASDGDGDRNMVVGKGVYINPCDSLAILAANSHLIPYFKDKLLTGVARSLPTSRAIDVVCEKLDKDCFVTPTGWKFFGNLLDKDLIQMCGEESFGTSGSHIREKDGIWAVLFWLNILAASNLSAKQVVYNHWAEYGRHYYIRYDFENLDFDSANSLINNLNEKSIINLSFDGQIATKSGQFNYFDKTDSTTTINQGYEATFSNKARFIVRLSGTGTSGATLRLYLEKYSNDFNNDAKKELTNLANTAIEFIEIEKFCNKTTADNII